MIPTTEPCLTMTDIAITIGDSEVPPSLELAMRYVRSADAQPLTLRSDPKYAFGSSTTRPQIPPNASFQFTIHPSPMLPHSLIKKDQLTLSDKIAKMTTKKTLGNWEFGCSEYQRALKLYGGGAELANSTLAETEAEAEAEAEVTDETANQNITTILISCMNNIALCQFKLGDYRKSKDACVETITIDPNNVKAIVRAALCCIEMADYSEAQIALNEVLKFDESNPNVEAVRALNVLKRRKLAYRQKKKEMGRKMGMAGVKKEAESPCSVVEIEEPDAKSKFPFWHFSSFLVVVLSVSIGISILLDRS